MGSALVRGRTQGNAAGRRDRSVGRRAANAARRRHGSGAVARDGRARAAGASPVPRVASARPPASTTPGTRQLGASAAALSTWPEHLPDVGPIAGAQRGSLCTVDWGGGFAPTASAATEGPPEPGSEPRWASARRRALIWRGLRVCGAYVNVFGACDPRSSEHHASRCGGRGGASRSPWRRRCRRAGLLRSA
jgi:hypothetical protein